MDRDSIDYFAEENRKRAAEIAQLTKSQHITDKEVRELRALVAQLMAAQPGEGSEPSAQAQRDSALPSDATRAAALRRMGPPGLPF